MTNHSTKGEPMRHDLAPHVTTPARSLNYENAHD